MACVCVCRLGGLVWHGCGIERNLYKGVVMYTLVRLTVEFQEDLQFENGKERSTLMGNGGVACD